MVSNASLTFFHVLVFGLLFCSCVIGFLSWFFFTTEVSAPFRSTLTSSLYLSSRFGIGSGIHLICGRRGGVGDLGVHMQHTSRSILLLWPRFEPHTFHLTVQSSANRPWFYRPELKPTYQWWYSGTGTRRKAAHFSVYFA